MSSPPLEFFLLLDACSQPEAQLVDETQVDESKSVANSAKGTLLFHPDHIFIDYGFFVILNRQNYDNRYLYLCVYLLKEFFNNLTLYKPRITLEDEQSHRYAKLLYDVVCNIPVHQSIFINSLNKLPVKCTNGYFMELYVMAIQTLRARGECSIDQKLFALAAMKGVLNFFISTSDTNHDSQFNQFCSVIIPYLMNPEKKEEDFLICSKMIKLCRLIPESFLIISENENFMFNVVLNLFANPQNVILEELYPSSVKFYYNLSEFVHSQYMYYACDQKSIKVEERKCFLENILNPNFKFFMDYLLWLPSAFPEYFAGIGAHIVSSVAHFFNFYPANNFLSELCQIAYAYSQLSKRETENFEVNPADYYCHVYLYGRALASVPHACAEYLFEKICTANFDFAIGFFFSKIKSESLLRLGNKVADAILCTQTSDENILLFHNFLAEIYHSIQNLPPHCFLSCVHLLARSLPIMTDEEQYSILQIAYLLMQRREAAPTPEDRVNYSVASEIIYHFVALQKPMPNELLDIFLQNAQITFTPRTLDAISRLKIYNPEHFKKQILAVVSNCLIQLDGHLAEIRESEKSFIPELAESVITSILDCLTAMAINYYENFPTIDILNRIRVLIDDLDQTDLVPVAKHFFVSLAKTLNPSYVEALNYWKSHFDEVFYNTFAPELLEPFIHLVGLHPTEFIANGFIQSLFDVCFSRIYILDYNQDKFACSTLISRIIQLRHENSTRPEYIQEAYQYAMALLGQDKNKTTFMALEIIASLVLVSSENQPPIDNQIVIMWANFCQSGYLGTWNYFRKLHGYALFYIGQSYPENQQKEIQALARKLLLNEIKGNEVKNMSSFLYQYGNITAPIDFYQTGLPFIEAKEENDAE